MRALAFIFGVFALVASLQAQSRKPLDPRLPEGQTEPAGLRFTDIEDNTFSVEVQRMGIRGIFRADPTVEADPKSFDPDTAITGDVLVKWNAELMRYAERFSEAALYENAVSEVDPAVLSAPMPAGAFRRQAWGANRAVLRPDPQTMQARSGQTREEIDFTFPVTRAEAAASLFWFVQELVEAGPGDWTAWELAFIDEFKGESLDRARWGEDDAGKPTDGVRLTLDSSVSTAALRESIDFMEARVGLQTATSVSIRAILARDEEGTRPAVYLETTLTAPNEASLAVVSGEEDRREVGSFHLRERVTEFDHVVAFESRGREVVFLLNGFEVGALDVAAFGLERDSGIEAIEIEAESGSVLVDFVRGYRSK